MDLLVVDDEPLALGRLTRLLRDEHHTVFPFEDPLEALAFAQTRQCDGAFLDIAMPTMSGIELAYRLRDLTPQTFIIFQTAYETHSLEAFKIGAVDYLLKPYTSLDVRRALQRIEQFHKRDYEPLRLLLKNGDESVFVTPEEIIYVQADLAEVIVRCVKGLFYYNATMTKVQALLEPYGFFRIHRTYLININKIKTMTPRPQSKIALTFEGVGETIESSKEGAKHFRARYVNKDV